MFKLNTREFYKLVKSKNTYRMMYTVWLGHMRFALRFSLGGSLIRFEVRVWLGESLVSAGDKSCVKGRFDGGELTQGLWWRNFGPREGACSGEL